MSDLPPSSSPLPDRLAETLLDTFGSALARISPGSDDLVWCHTPTRGLLIGIDQCRAYRALEERVHPTDRPAFRSWWNQLATPAAQGAHQTRVLDPEDQTPQWVHLLRVDLPAGPHLLLRDLKDVSLRVFADAEARRLATIETMAAGIAHEFNNNMTPIRGYLELAVDELGRNHPVCEGLQTALDRVEYCAGLVGQLQQYGRRAVLHRREAHIGHLLHSLLNVGLAMFGNPDNPVRLEEHIASDLPTVAVDHSRFREVIYHLVKNALAAMPARGTLQVWAEAVSSDALDQRVPGAQSDFIRIRIVDNGTGMDSDTVNRVFDPFFTTANRAERLGLGLSMAQGVVAQHGGWIELHSTHGTGTEVRMFFPVMKSSTPSASSDQGDDALPVIAAAPVGRMLVADDETYVRQLVSRIFAAEGWLIDEAANHDETLQLSTRHPDYYRVIVLDITMPGPSAEETVERLQQVSPGSTILLISGLERNHRIEGLLTRGASAFLPKPFSPKKLLEVVDELVPANHD